LPVVPRPLKWYKKLATTKGRQETGMFLVEGSKSIDQILKSHPEAVCELLTVEEPLPVCQGYPLRRLTASQMRTICHTRTPQGIVAVVRFPAAMYTSELPGAVGARVLLLEDVQDPGNVGTLIRTAAAFDFSGIITTDKGADPLSPKCVQATAGTVLSAWIRRTAHYLDLVRALRGQGYACVVTEARGPERPQRLATLPRLVLALGNEAAGISPALRHMADVCVGIPLGVRAESLNVAVSGAICMYHCYENPIEWR
jgi:TrmH family RNA methyltransferase